MTSTNDVLPPKHSYWSLFHIGLKSNGSWWSAGRLFLDYPFICLILLLLSIGSSSVSLYFFEKIKNLQEADLWFQIFVITGTVWSSYLTTVVRFFLRDRINEINGEIMSNILEYVHNLTTNPTNKYKVHLDHPCRFAFRETRVNLINV